MRLIPLLLGLFLTAAACAQNPAQKELTMALEPLCPAPLPDPTVFEKDGFYHIFGTAVPYFFRADSLDIHSMELMPFVLDRGELDPDFPIFEFWGFDVYEHTDGSWHAYATAHWGYFKTGIAHLIPAEGERWTPDRPICKWKLNNIMVGDVKAGIHFAYDAKVYRDEKGQLFMLYCNAAGEHEDIHIYARKMADPATFDPESEPWPILSPEGYRSEDRNRGYKQLVEGARIVPFGDWYALFYSVGDYTQNSYKVGVAWSKKMIPPPGETYEKITRPNPDMLFENTEKKDEVLYLLQSEEPRWPHYIANLVNCPGIASPVREGEKWSLVFHGYFPHDTYRLPWQRFTYKLPLEVRIDPNRPKAEWLQVRLPGTSSE